MSKALWQSGATREAEALIRELGITSLPVSPMEIARVLGIEIQPIPPQDQPGVSGMLLRHGNQFGILYSTSIDSDGYQNFSIGHEIGHYRLPGHPESVLQDGVHVSHAGFKSKNRFELEADYFAAGLLMPTSLFDAALNRTTNGLDAVVDLSALCETSLTATAIRFAQRSPDATAIIVSEGNKIDYCFMSDTLREHDGIEWIKKGTLLPQTSATKRLNGDASKVEANERADAASEIRDWFGGSLEAEVVEEAIGLGPYGKTLTVLSIEDLPDAEELEDEEELEESWTPRFRR